MKTILAVEDDTREAGLVLGADTYFNQAEGNTPIRCRSGEA